MTGKDLSWKDKMRLRVGLSRIVGSVSVLTRKDVPRQLKPSNSIQIPCVVRKRQPFATLKLSYLFFGSFYIRAGKKYDARSKGMGRGVSNLSPFYLLSLLTRLGGVGNKKKEQKRKSLEGFTS